MARAVAWVAPPPSQHPEPDNRPNIQILTRLPAAWRRGGAGVERPAGVVDPGAPSPESAARRELLEETGYGGGAWRPLLVASANPARTATWHTRSWPSGSSRSPRPPPSRTRTFGS